ncbi:hypothetical protein LZ24_01420 [Desulfobotulus alkaliphilus]|uniref:Bacterial repeat domain-containing protein n=1 Tax=Desulfobotulus alkaliphilus TaxID=622671 RepID=A0A562RVB4_9BACT|nr:hypothetical protein [Desulfobotulus alkaliphilus]TWI73009.1 hypothetical protein LZ24_01420 [Desulfobotulus alkaliphilus]
MPTLKNFIITTLTLCFLVIFPNQQAEASEKYATMGEKLIEVHDALLGRVVETLYTNNNYIFDNQGKFYVDCSYWVGKILEELDTSIPDPDHPSPYFNDFPKSSRTQPDNPQRPRAKDYYEHIMDIANGKQSPYWQSVGHIRDALPGDLIAYKHTDGDVPGNTGHVMIIYSEPQKISEDTYEMYIADATSSPHGSDTRNKEGDYAHIFNYESLPRVPGGLPSGVGIGKMVFSTPEVGDHTYRWRGNTPDSPPTKAGRDGILAIGRPVETFTVSTVSGFTDAIRPVSSHVIQGNTTSFTLFPPSGYTIDHVRGCGGSLSGNTYTTGPVTGACTIEASFRLRTYAVNTLSSGAGGSIQPDTRSVGHGQSTSFIISPDSGYEIESVGGCGGSLSGNTYTTGPVTGACTIEASFRLRTYAVNTLSGAGGSIQPDTRSVGHGQSTSFVISPDSGYEIESVGGCGGSLSGNTYTTGPVTGACTIEAAFRLRTYAVNALSGAGGSIQPDTRSVGHGQSTSFIISPDSGYEIESVGGCDGSLSGNTYTTGPVTGACTVEALFQPIAPVSHTVSTRSSQGGSIYPSARNVHNGQRTEFIILAEPGYAIETVDGCDGILFGNTYTTGSINAACTVEADFKSASVYYTLNYHAGINGKIFGLAMQSVREGSHGTIVSAIPDLGYVFAGWSDGSKENPRRDLNVKANLSVTASFEPSSFTIKDKNGNSVDKISAELGDVVFFSVSDGFAPEISQVRINDITLPVEDLLRQTDVGKYELDILKTGLYSIEVRDLARKEVLNIIVYPRVGFVSETQTTGAGNAVSVKIFMEGRAPYYPVRVPFETQGAAWIFPEDLRKGEIIFNKPLQDEAEVQMAALVFQTTAKISSALDVDFVLGEPVHAQKSTLARHPLPLSPAPQPPVIHLSLLQPDISMPVTALVQGQGPGMIRSYMVRNGCSDVVYEWSLFDTKGRPVHAPGNVSEWVLDPSIFPSGVYDLGLQVSSASCDISSYAGMRFRILDTCPAPSAPGDGCGVLDFSENRIPDYLDPEHVHPNRIRLVPGANDYAETVPGLRIRPGPVAYAAGKQGIQITMEDLLLYGGLSGSPAHHAEDGGMRHYGFLYDFEISGFSSSGQSTRLIIPLTLNGGIQRESILRIYDSLYGWHTFVEDSRNRVRSAHMKPAGICPGPGSGQYSDGLAEGHTCVLLEIEDGGPNDIKRYPDGITGFLWGLAVSEQLPPPDPQPPSQPHAEEKSSSGACMIGALLPGIFLK